jgi:hypothetical protein
MSWPREISLNAWTGSEIPHGQISPEAAIQWAHEGRVDAFSKVLAPGPPASLADWRHPEVGWGLILPEAASSMSWADRALARDAPKPIQQLLAARPGAPVFRYLQADGQHVLRRYYPGRPPQDPDLAFSNPGVDVGQVPRYLLICATPLQVPWSFQSKLNSGSGRYMVGRLHLTGDALGNYIDHLLHEWRGASARVEQPVVWATDWGQGDMTRAMRRLIANPLAAALRGDTQIGDRAWYLDGSTTDASSAALLAALVERQPGLVVTTSHGMLGPQHDLDAFARTLGLPVDNHNQPLDLESICSSWAPDGAIWYAHACCSAGSDAPSRLAGLLSQGSNARAALERTAELGSMIAPLPSALLGADKPLRAFVGHVEPTFNWTIQHSLTQQSLAGSIERALYKHLYQPEPLGLALRVWYEGIGIRLRDWFKAEEEYTAGRDTEEVALANQLIAYDRAGTVILGDPTVALPKLPA